MSIAAVGVRPEGTTSATSAVQMVTGGGETAVAMPCKDAGDAEGGLYHVPVTFDRAQESTHWPQIFESQRFKLWLALYENHESLSLVSVAVKYLKMSAANEVETLLISPTLKDRLSDEVIVPTEEILLRQDSNHLAGILVMLRCTYHDENRREMPNSSSRDFVLYCATTRAAIGKAENMEIVTGSFTPTGEFVSPYAEELSKRLNIRIHMDDLVCLTPSRAVVPDSRQLHESINLYLYRQNISEEELNNVPKANVALKSDDEKSSLRLTTLGEAWKITRDTKSIAALFYFHEFRYHRLMPKYKPPRDAKAFDVARTEKRKPEFVEVDALNPAVSGVNLRVKVVKPMDAVSETQRREGKTLEAVVVVGDASGIVNLRLEGSQLEIPEVKTEGACLTVQNSRIDMVNQCMVLCVDKWGKINAHRPDDEEFDFTPLTSNNKSEIEYELVQLNEEGSTPPRNSSKDAKLRGDYGPETGSDRRRRGGGGGRVRSRGRGRGGDGGGRGGRPSI